MPRGRTKTLKRVAAMRAARVVDHDEVLRLIREGFSQSEVGRRVGITRERVRQICAVHGVISVPGTVNHDLRDAIYENPSYTAKEFAAKFDVSESAVYFNARAIGVKLAQPSRPTPTTDRIRELAAKGLTVGEVAQALGIAQSSVSFSKRRYGIEFKRDGRRKN